METEAKAAQDDSVRISKTGWGMVAGVVLLMSVHPFCHAVVRKKVSADLLSVRQAVISVCSHSAEGARLSEPLEGMIYVDQRYVGAMPSVDRLCSSPASAAAIDEAFDVASRAIASAIDSSSSPAPRVLIKRTYGQEVKIREVGASLLSRLVGFASLDLVHLITKPWAQMNWEDYMPTAQMPVHGQESRLLASRGQSGEEATVR